MGKITNFVLTFALLFIGVGGVKAGKLNATLSSLSNGPTSTWDTYTSTITWTGTSNNMISNFDFVAGDYKQYVKIGVNITSITNAEYVRIQIRANGKEITQKFSGTGTIEKSLTNDYGFTVADLENFEWARMLGSSEFTGGATSASAVISGVYLEAPTRLKVVNLSEMAASSGKATWAWDAVNNTGVFAWTLNYSNSITLPGLSGNLSAYSTINFATTEGTCDHFRILIYYTNGKAQTTYYTNVGTKSVTFASMGVEKKDLAFISSINISGAGDVSSGDINLTSFSLEGPDVNYIEAFTTYEKPAGTTDLKSLTGTNVDWSTSVKYSTILGSAGEFCGNGNGGEESTHVTISDYDYICFEVTKVVSGGQPLRVWIWDGSAVVTLYAYPIADYATAAWTTANVISSPGTYVVKVSDYNYLKGMKTPNNGYGGSITISTAYLSAGEAPIAYKSTGVYTLCGETVGASSLTTVLADVNAIYYDATGVAGTGIELTPTGNPNALFRANSGVLSNANNVIVGSTCAKLDLTDGHPFKAPAAFTATAAPTYDRAFTASTTTTVCLPFALTAAEAATLGTFYELSSFDGSTLRFTSVDAPVANKAYLVKTKAADPALTLSETEKSIVATPADLGTAVTNVDFIGTLESTVIPASGDDYSYYAYNNGSLVKIVTNAATLPAFRGYFKVTTSAISAARSLNISFDNEATGISAALMNSDERTVRSEVYNLNGQRVAAPQKGLYIVNGKKAIVK